MTQSANGAAAEAAATDAASTGGTPVTENKETQELPTTADTGVDATAGENGDEATASQRRSGFTQWRRSRPFFAGLLMLLGGVVILTPAYLSLEVSNIIIQVSTISGVSTFIIGALLIACGLMTWFGGGSRILTGVAGIILGIVALPTSNFGGFVLGTLLALVGGALALSWTESSKEELAAQREAKKQQKTDRATTGSSKTSGASNSTAVAVLAAVTATGLAAGLTATAGAPPAQAQLELPKFPDLPGAPKAPGAAKPPAQQRPAAPKLPETPKLPDPPKLPDLPKLGEAPKLPEIPEEYEMDLTPPAPIEGLQGIPGNTFQITTDSTSLLGNMKLSLITLETQQGPKPALRIDADKAVLQNLAMEMPGQSAGPIWQRTGPGKTSVLSGNFHIIVSKLTITPEIAGVKTIPITIDASWAPEEIKKEAAKMGLGQPDALSEKLRMLDGTMEAYVVSSDRIDLPKGTSLAP
ncbi:MAG: hypothetical protein DI609_04150 [Corynebacterium urealyticum]|uniref:Uncharacterized protein n=1 Tax=Corynebacterium urealyticum TaxID=43771 RepID=A0A2W5D2B1_9CORY|nr:MAG: hypothetical protein DI609_04150 [Corynebacterium urealyticum]